MIRITLINKYQHLNYDFFISYPYPYYFLYGLKVKTWDLLDWGELLADLVLIGGNFKLPFFDFKSPFYC